MDLVTDATLWAEEWSVFTHAAASRLVGLLLIFVLVAAVSYLDRITKDNVDAGIFYHLPIVLACAFFGARGFLMVPLCSLLFHLNEMPASNTSVTYSFGNDLSHVGSFGIIAALTLCARSLHLSLAEKSRQLVAEQRLADSEMALAEQVQRCLFNIPAEGYEDAWLTIHGYSTSPSRVGGDFCRMVDRGEELALFVGDVIGTGVPAALGMAMCIAALTGDARYPSSPDLDLQRCNEVLFNSFRDDQVMTATACAAAFDRRTSEFVFSLAGHEPPILPGGCAAALGARCSVPGSDAAVPPSTEHRAPSTSSLGAGHWAPGILMGAVPQPEYPLYRLPLRPGDQLVLFTDGATEARNPEGEQFGRERLEAAVRRSAHLPAPDALRSILTAVQSHTGSDSPNDDLTLVLVERRRANGA